MSKNQITEIKDGIWELLQSSYITSIRNEWKFNHTHVLINHTFQIIFWKNQLLNIQQKIRPEIQNALLSLKQKCGAYSRYLQNKKDPSISFEYFNLIIHGEYHTFISYGFNVNKSISFIEYDSHFDEILSTFDPKTEDIEHCYLVINQIEVLVEKKLIHLEMTIQSLLEQIEMILANVDQYTDLSFETEVSSS